MKKPRRKRNDISDEEIKRIYFNPWHPKPETEEPEHFNPWDRKKVKKYKRW